MEDFISMSTSIFPCVWSIVLDHPKMTAPSFTPKITLQQDMMQLDADMHCMKLSDAAPEDRMEIDDTAMGSDEQMATSEDGDEDHEVTRKRRVFTRSRAPSPCAGLRTPHVIPALPVTPGPAMREGVYPGSRPPQSPANASTKLHPHSMPRRSPRGHNEANMIERQGS